MPGLLSYSDVPLFINHKLLVNKAYYKTIFLVYVVHNNNLLILYKVQQGCPVRILLIKKLRVNVDLDSFITNVDIDCTLHATRVAEEFFIIHDILVAIVSTTSADRSFGLSFNNWA